MTAPVAAPTRRMWIGPFVHEAAKAYVRALDAGANVTAALVEGEIASFRDCWAFRSVIAKRLGRSVRTVQRKITDAKNAGRIHVHRSKYGEKPPGGKAPLWCGFSHKFTSGWGKADDEVAREVERARLRQMERRITASMHASSRPPRRTLPSSLSSPRTRWAAFAPQPPPLASSAPSSPKATPPASRSSAPDKRWTADELDRELERIARERKARDGPD